MTLADPDLSSPHALEVLPDPSQGPNGLLLLLISEDGCASCERMKRALGVLTTSEADLPPVYQLATEADLLSVVADYQCLVFPTLILYEDGMERTRWGGYFELPEEEARERMRQVLLQAAARKADTHAGA